MKAILYIGHGTRSKKGAVEAKAFIKRVMAQIDAPIQELCFLELTQPLIEDGFSRCLERGASEITVVPLFLLAAGHIKEDIPLELASLQEKYPHIRVEVKDPFGVQASILDGIAELIFSNVGSLAAQDRLLIVGRGSSDTGILADFAAIADGLRTRLGISDVSVCFLAASKPTFDEGLEAIAQHTPAKIVVVPYLLFSGLLLAEVNQKVSRLQKEGLEIVHTGPLSGHKIIEDLVITRAAGGEYKRVPAALAVGKLREHAPAILPVKSI